METDFTEGKVKKGGWNPPPTSPKPKIKPVGQMIKTGYLQLVEGSFKPYSCNCDVKKGAKHSLDCPKLVFTSDPNLPYIVPYVWPPVIKPQSQGEQCGRCWQNHTPGFVCACNCHSIKPMYTTTTAPMVYDNGDDLDYPPMCGQTDPADI